VALVFILAIVFSISLRSAHLNCRRSAQAAIDRVGCPPLSSSSLLGRPKLAVVTKMMRSFTRVQGTSSALLHQQLSTSIRLAPLAACPNKMSTSQRRSASAHAISNPTLANIEKRWEAMPPQEQAQLWMDLRDRMKADWHELTLQERKAGM